MGEIEKKEKELSLLKEFAKLHPEDLDLGRIIKRYQDNETQINKLPTIPSIMDMYNTNSSSVFSVMQRIAAENKIVLTKEPTKTSKTTFKKKEISINNFIYAFECEIGPYYLAESEDFFVILFFSVLEDDNERLWYQKMLEERLNQKKTS